MIKECKHYVDEFALDRNEFLIGDGQIAKPQY